MTGITTRSNGGPVLPLSAPRAPNFESLFDLSAGLDLILDTRLMIVAASDAFLAATMTKRDQIVGQNLFVVFPDNPGASNVAGKARLRASLARVASKRVSDTMSVQRYDIRRPDGTFEIRYWSPVNLPICDSDGHLTHFILRVEDVTEFILLRAKEAQVQEEASAVERRTAKTTAETVQRSEDLHDANRKLRLVIETAGELEGKLRHQTLHDPLTGLASRQLFRDRVQHALDGSHRTGGSHAVLFIDVDLFKLVNDTLGHGAGDTVLIELAGRLPGAIRPADTAARLGGDEFALLLEDVTEADALAAAERVLALIRRPIRLGNKQRTLTASIGIAMSKAGDGVEDILRNADVAMYVAKNRGRNRHVLFTPDMHEAAARRFDLESDLRSALDDGELFLQYQPVVSVPDRQIVGVEALVRWQHPERGLVGPAEFIPIAEENNDLMCSLGLWVMKKACIQAKLWAEMSSTPIWLSVNVSMHQITSDGFVSEVQDALLVSSLDPSLLVLEITESLFIENVAANAAKMRALRELGVRFAIDDFGTGYSSLSYLRDLPVDILKIDKSFVDRIAEGAIQAAGGRAVLKIAQAFGLTAVAEGVERKGQAEALARLDCGLAQGYFYSRPLDPGTLNRLLDHQTAA